MTAISQNKPVALTITAVVLVLAGVLLMFIVSGYNEGISGHRDITLYNNKADDAIETLFPGEEEIIEPGMPIPMAPEPEVRTREAVLLSLICALAIVIFIPVIASNIANRRNGPKD